MGGEEGGSDPLSKAVLAPPLGGPEVALSPRAVAAVPATSEWCACFVGEASRLRPLRCILGRLALDSNAKSCFGVHRVVGKLFDHV